MKTKNSTSTNARNKLALLAGALSDTASQQLESFTGEEISWILANYSGKLAFDLEREFQSRKPDPVTRSSPLDEIIKNNKKT